MGLKKANIPVIKMNIPFSPTRIGLKGIFSVLIMNELLKITAFLADKP